MEESKMIIQSSAIEMASKHSYVEKSEVQESLRIWKDGANGENAAAAQSGGSASPYEVKISDLAKKMLAAGETAESSATDSALQLSEEDKMKIELLERFIEHLTGKKFRFRILDRLRGNGQAAQSGSAAPAAQGNGQPARKGWGMVYNYHESHYEAEKLSFQAAGVVKTADGREINFAVDMKMSRQFYSETNVNIRAGDALTDPLAINYAAPGVSLTDQKYAFDIDADGDQDQISFVGQGSGFLALDKNSDGKVNDGSELFGPQSGNGFADLAAYDSDGNNWIDENDAVYGQLRIWTKDAQGQDAMFSLSEAGVGAIYLGNVDTAFAVKDASNQLQGQLRQTGVFLKEDGGAGTIQQIDLAV
jgi:hypothetical protein